MIKRGYTFIFFSLLSPRATRKTLIKKFLINSFKFGFEKSVLLLNKKHNADLMAHVKSNLGNVIPYIQTMPRSLIAKVWAVGNWAENCSLIAKYYHRAYSLLSPHSLNKLYFISWHKVREVFPFGKRAAKCSHSALAQRVMRPEPLALGQKSAQF